MCTISQNSLEIHEVACSNKTIKKGQNKHFRFLIKSNLSD